jgi:hypothetical protein
MTYKLFIDDERFPAAEGYLIVRSSGEAIEACKEYGFPDYISFDHDLGGEDTSMIFINWMIDRTLDSMVDGVPGLHFPRNYYVHSQNSVGVQNIRGLMDGFIRYLDDL